MSIATIEIVIGVILGVIAGALALAVAFARLKTGVEDDTVQSYKNALDATKAEAESLRHELASVKAELAATREQVNVLSNMVTAREDIAGVRELLESHHREDMAAHEEHKALLLDVIAMRGGTRARQTFDRKESDNGSSETV